MSIEDVAGAVKEPIQTGKLRHFGLSEAGAQMGQTLIVTAGVGWVQQEGGEKQEIKPGGIIWRPPGVKHRNKARRLQVAPTWAESRRWLFATVAVAPCQWLLKTVTI